MTAANGAMLVIISGPSGVGKDTIIDALKRRPHDPEYHYVVTCTTRAMRPGEVDGVDYHLPRPGDVRGAARRRRVPRGEQGPRELVRHAAQPGPRGARSPAATSSSRSTSRAPRSSRSKVPGALLIFLIPPSLEDLFQRLRSRATETADELEVRQRNAAIELARQEDYDYVVTNETGQVERTAERIDEIIAEEHAQPSRPPGRGLLAVALTLGTRCSSTRALAGDVAADRPSR